MKLRKLGISKALTSTVASLSALGAMLVAGTPAYADTLVENIQGISLDEEGSTYRFSALWIDNDGRVKQLLQNTDKRPARFDYVVDGKGKYVMPGFVDAHTHIMSLGLAALTLDLSDTQSLEEARAKIAKYAAENPGRPWLLGRGWNQEKWGLGRFPTAADLDDLVPDKPVWFMRADGHAAWANSAAMRSAGVTAKSEAPRGGKMERGANGEPAGVFVDAALDMVQKAVPAPHPKDRDVALIEAQKILLSHGVTAAADMGVTIADWQAFRRAGDNGTLFMRIMAYASGIAEMELIAGAQPTPWLYQDRLRMGGVKIYLDGALGSRGALLKKPYDDAAGQSGLALLSSTQLRNIMSRAAMSDFQVAIHAIGDAANAEALSAITELSTSYKGDRRWRIEHAQVIDMADIALFNARGIVASMQPIHQISDWPMAQKRLGSGRLEGAYAWRAIQKAGGRLAFGSDTPVESAAPFPAIAAAISARSAAQNPAQNPAATSPDERAMLTPQALSRENAIAAYTSGGAYAGFAEHRFGMLKPGQWADFIVIDGDPFLLDSASLGALKPRETWVAGRRVFAAVDPQ